MSNSDVDGVLLLVRDGNEALLFPAGNTAAAYENIRNLYDDPELSLRLGRSARLRAEECFSGKKVLQEYSRLLTGLENEKNTGHF